MHYKYHSKCKTYLNIIQTIRYSKLLDISNTKNASASSSRGFKYTDIPPIPK